MPKELTPAERQALKGRAHRVRPVVLVGAAGLTPPVVAEVDRALQAHGLIKIRVLGEDRDARERLLGEVCAATDASPVQHVGRILVIYREQPEKPVPKAPPARASAPRRRPQRPARKPRPARRVESRRGKFRPR